MEDTRYSPPCYRQTQKPIEKEFKSIQYKIQIVESYFHSTLLAHGAFAGYRKEIIPELPQEITSDDAEVSLSAIKKGYRVIFDQTVISSEYYPEDFKLRREMKDRRAAGLIKVIIENISMIFNPKYSWFGMLTLPLNCFVLILTPVLLIILGVLLIIYGILFQYLVIILLAVLLTAAFIFLHLRIKNVWLARIKAILDVNLSCIIGLFKAFSKDKVWKRSERQRIAQK